MKLNEAKDYILNNLSIVDIIGSYVKLKKSGSSYKGLCPFHNEKTPSFFVNEQKRIFHCFGCGASGDIITFIMKIERLSYVETIKKLGLMLNIEIEFDTDKGKSKEKDEKEIAFKIYSEVKNFYKEALQKNSEAKSYLINRNIDDKTIEFFEIGYAPDNQKTFFESILNKYKIDLGFLYKYSLISYPNLIKPFFEKRIIIPIKNIWGDIVAFAGRIISEKNLPKYINSKETPIFQKQNLLFNLNNIKNLKDDSLVFIVEGYFDVITGWKNGLSYCVAPMGTSLTLNHIKIISRKVDKIHLLFDNDEAGFNAFLRTISLFIQSDSVTYPFFVKLPDNVKDIDEYFNKGYSLEDLTKNIIDGYNVYFSKILEINNKNRNIEKILKNFFESIKDINDDIKLKFLFKKISEIDFTFREDELYNFYNKYKNKVNLYKSKLNNFSKINQNIEITNKPEATNNEAKSIQVKSDKLNFYEKDLCKFMFFYPQYLQFFLDITGEKNLHLIVSNSKAILFLFNFNNYIKDLNLQEYNSSNTFNDFFNNFINNFINNNISTNEEGIFDEIKNFIGEYLIRENKDDDSNNFSLDIEINPEKDFIKILKKFYIKKYTILLKKIRHKILEKEKKLKDLLINDKNSIEFKNVEKERDSLLLKLNKINSKINNLKTKDYKDLLSFLFEIDYMNFERYFIYFLIKNYKLIEDVKEYVLLNDINYFSNLYTLLLNSLNYKDFNYYLKLEGVEELDIYYNSISKNPLFNYDDNKIKKVLLYLKYVKTEKNINLLNRKIEEIESEKLKNESKLIDESKEKELKELKEKKNELKLYQEQILLKIKEIDK